MNAATADARTALTASAAEVPAPDGAGAAATGAGLGTCAHTEAAVCDYPALANVEGTTMSASFVASVTLGLYN